MSEWQEIETAPTGDEMFLAYCPPCEEFTDGRVMIWRGRILASLKPAGTPHHLRYPATHWMPLPEAPK